MIISHHHRFIFYAIPKTGSQSIRLALRPHLHKYDWEQCSLFEKKIFPVAKIAKISHGHISYKIIDSVLWPKITHDYFSFCFVRDPLDRFLSYCYFAHGEELNKKKHTNEVMKNIIRNPVDQKHILFRPQYEFICDSDGIPRVQFIGHYEHLQNDYNYICNSFDFPNTKIAHINSSDKPKINTLDSELKQMVFDYYRKDYLMFDYSITQN